MRALTILGLFCANLLLAQSTISGTVTDAETNEPIPGVNIVIQGTTEGTNTDFDGNFSLSTNRAVPFTIEVSSVGFGSKSIEVTAADQALSISLDAGENLEEIIVSASRRPQKIQEAPASVSVVSAKDIENSAIAVDPARHLVNVPGVQIQQQSVNSINIEMRAGSGVFGTSTLPMLDYRFLSQPAAGNFFTHQAGLSNIDIAKIEVVRGAAGALYGPGVTSGVVHFMSKNPIDHPGTTVELIGGELNTQGAALRHAYAADSGKFGYKINVKWAKGNDFQLDPDEDADAIASMIAGLTKTDANGNEQAGVYQPYVANQMVDPTRVGDRLLSFDQMDDNGDGNPLATKYENTAVNAHLEFRPNDKTNAFLSGGYANGGALMFNSQGYGFRDGEDYWAQARVQSGGLFAQVFWAKNTGGDEENPTFLYNSGFRQVAETEALEGQIQYNFDLPDFLNSNFTIGADYRDTKSNSDYTLFGRNDDDDPYTIMGAYLQGTSELTDKLEMTYAARYDTFTFMDETAFSPRVALVYKANDKNTFRASYNVANSAPTALTTYIDFPVSVIVPGVYDVWLAGENAAQNFDAGAPIEFPLLGGLTLPQNSQSVPNAALVGALNANNAIPAIMAAFSTVPQLQPLQPFAPILEGVLQNPATLAAIQGASGQLGQGYNVFNGQPYPVEDLSGTPAARLSILNSFEVGYNGIIGDKLKVSLDVYTYERKGFTQFTAIAPVIPYQPDGDSFAQAVGASLAPLLAPQVTAAVTPQIQATYQTAATQLAGFGIPITYEQLAANGFDASQIPGVDSIPTLAAALEQTVSDVVGGLAAAAAGGYQQGLGTLPASALAVFGTIESQRVPQNDGVTHIPAGYRKYGDATRSHWGADLALEYFATDALSIWGNASWLSQNEWVPGESNDDDLPFYSALNAPQFKYRLGVKYAANKIQGSLTFQHDDAFMSDQGFFAGEVQEKNLFDMNIGYVFSEKLRFDITGSNIFDFKYRAFPGMPVIGRRVLGKLTFDL